MSNRVSARNQKFYKQLEESYCDVCFSYFRKVPPKNINEGLEILVCTKCHCKVHKCCYDLQPNQSVVINEKLSEFVCQKCSEPKLITKQCLVCHHGDGALIITEEKQLIHIFCALYHNQIDIMSYTPRVRVQKSISYEPTNNLCDVCKLPNAFESCAFQNCKKSAHPYCAKKLYVDEEMKHDEPKCWNHHLNCGPSNLFDLKNQIMSFSLLKDTISQEFHQVEQSAPFQIPNKDTLIKEVYDEYITEAKQQKIQSKSIKRGGFSFISCPEHEFTPYCICNGTGQGGQMIECETCFAWYHMECIKLKQTPNDGHFSCMFCKSFYDLKKKIIDEVIGGKNDNFEIKCELPTKMSFMDVMWIMRGIDAKISKGNIQKMVKELSKYPLRTSKMDKLIKIQNKKKLEILCEDFFHEYFFSDQQIKFFKPAPVLGLDETNKPIKLEQNIQKNKQLRQFISALRNFCKKQGIVSEFKAIQSELDFKEEAVSDSYEKIIELSKSQQKYQEVAILKIKAQAYSFLQIVKKVNSGSIITINQLQQSVRKASLIQNVPEYLTQPLTDKYQKVKSILNHLKQLIQRDPYNLLEIKQTANKLTTDYKIQPPILYDIYLEERNFTNSLYFYYVKQTEGKIQAELEFKQKLSELVSVTNSQSFTCNQELTKNLNSFFELRQKANNPKYAFEELQIITMNLEKRAIKQTLTNLQPNSIFRKQKLEYLFGKFIEYKIQDSYISSLMNKYELISKDLTEVVQKSLQNITSINILRMLEDSCNELINQLQRFPLKVEQQIKNNKSITWLQLARNRKQEIGQLLTLAQQAQLQKNPLSLNKILDSIPKENSLVKNFKQLKKEHQQIRNQFINLMALCSEKIENLKTEGSKKQRKQQIEINDKKPDLKRFNQVLQMLTHSKVDFSKQIRDITKIINKSLDISYSVEKFCKAKQCFENFANADQLSNARKQIEELRKKVLLNSEIALTKELTQLYHCEIYSRMRSNVVAGNYDLQKNNKLLKFAEEQSLPMTPTYLKLKEKFETKNQKSKEINLIKNIETKLKEHAAKQTDPLFKNLYNARKQLKVLDVEQETPKISYIEELKEKNKQIKAKIAKYLSLGTNPQTKVSQDEAKSLLIEALKSPFNLSNLQQFYLDIERCHSFYTNWKRSNNLGRNTLYNDQKLREYEKLKFRVEQLQIASKEIYKLKSSLRILQTIENIQDESFESGLAQNCYQNLNLIQQNLETIEENQLAGEDSQMIMSAKRKYLKIWTQYVKSLRRTYNSLEDNKQLASKDSKNSVVLVNVKKINKLLYDSYFLLQTELKSTINMLNSEQIIGELRQSVIFLEQLFLEIKFNYLQGYYNKNTNIMDTWIDLDDFIYELKVGGSLDELFFVYKPFEDLSKFKYRNITSRNSDLLIASRVSVEQKSVKRTRPDDFQAKQQRPLMKKSSSQVVKNQESSDSEQKQNPNLVSAKSRKKVKQILSKNILKNPQLKKTGVWDNQVKMIENQIFGEYHDDVVKYFETSQKFQKLFIKLQSCPEISKKLIKKEFQFKIIKQLVESLNTIGDIEAMMVNKIKEEKNAEKFTATLQSSNLQNAGFSRIQEEQPNNVLEMLATGNVNEQYKKDLANEMRKIKEGKQKKKKKSKHRNRSRSRSASPEAKFSSESEQQNIPSYIQKEYAQQSSKTPFETKSDMDILPLFPRNDQPLMFDPEINEEEMEDIEKKYPRGSTLKIKQANLEFFLKRKGKMQMKINLYTLQDFKKINSQYVDPGFTSLNIRKEKNDKEILEYLNKPSKKKYRFLICWMEGQSVKQNENLEELSRQANQRHKIYGWQNDSIKIHVMSIKQFVQLTRFSTTIPNKTVFKECVHMFDEQRMICVIQYPAEKLYELKEKFKNFSDIERIDQTFEVSIPLPTYDTYEPIETQNPPFYPSMGDIHNPNIHSIKPMAFDDALIKQSKPVQFEGWGSSSIDTEIPTLGQTGNNPYEQTRIRLGFGRFSPINTDEQDNVPSVKEPLPDLADSLLKSFQKKEKFEITPIEQLPYKSERNFVPQSYEQVPYGNKYNRPQYQYGQQKYYDNVGGNNPMNPPGMNPMRGYNNPMGYNSNRNYNSNMGQNYNQNRYQNQGNEYRPNYNNQYNQNRNMPYNQRPNRNPMFNPMNNPMNPMQSNPMSNPMGNNLMQNNPSTNNPMQNNSMGSNPIPNIPMGFRQQNQYNQPQQQNNPRYPPYQSHGNTQGGYQQ